MKQNGERFETKNKISHNAGVDHWHLWEITRERRDLQRDHGGLVTDEDLHCPACHPGRGSEDGGTPEHIFMCQI